MSDQGPIETKEIRGINFSLIRSTLITVATIVCTVAFTYYNLKLGQNQQAASMQQLNSLFDNNNKLNELKLKSIETELNRQQVEIETLRKRVDNVTGKTTNQ